MIVPGTDQNSQYEFSTAVTSSGRPFIDHLPIKFEHDDKNSKDAQGGPRMKKQNLHQSVNRTPIILVQPVYWGSSSTRSINLEIPKHSSVLAVLNLERRAKYRPVLAIHCRPRNTVYVPGMVQYSHSIKLQKYHV